MKNALGIGMEHSDGGTTVLVLSGILRADSLDELRSRIRALVEDGCKVLLFDLQEAEIRGPEIREFFLEVLNDMRGRGGRVALIARRHDVLAYFASVRNILEIFPSRSKFRRTGLVETLKRGGVTYSKKTGVRLSLGMALVVVLILGGWILTLWSFVSAQSERIARQQELLSRYETERAAMESELEELHRKLAPLNALGLVTDSLMNADYSFSGDWIDHLEERFRRKEAADSLRRLQETEAKGTK